MITKNEKLIIWLSLFLFATGTLSLNIYLPTLLSLSQVFHTDINNVKLSISFFLFSYAVSQFIWGSLSEKFGRKKTILLGLATSVVGILIVLLAHNVFLFNLGRIIEGFGIGCTSVLARTILVDSMDMTKMALAMSYIATTNNILPALAPIIGGYLYYWLGWRSIFLFLLIYTVGLIFIFSKIFSETYANVQRNLNFKRMLLQYKEVLLCKEFLSYSLPALFLSGGLIGYYAVTPFIFLSALHFSPHNYAYFSIIPVGSYIIGNTVSRYIFPRKGFNKTILLGLAIALFAGVLAIINCFVFNLSAITVLIPMTIYALATGLTAPCCNAGAMASMRHYSGGASGAVLSAGYYLFWGIFSTISTHLPFNKLSSIAVYISLSAMVALLTFNGKQYNE